MGNKELKALYDQVNKLSSEEKKQLIVYLQAEPRPTQIEDVVTQEELDMLYAVAVQNQNSD